MRFSFHPKMTINYYKTRTTALRLIKYRNRGFSFMSSGAEMASFFVRFIPTTFRCGFTKKIIEKLIRDVFDNDIHFDFVKYEREVFDRRFVLPFVKRRFIIPPEVKVFRKFWTIMKDPSEEEVDPFEKIYPIYLIFGNKKYASRIRLMIEKATIRETDFTVKEHDEYEHSVTFATAGQVVSHIPIDQATAHNQYTKSVDAINKISISCMEEVRRVNCWIVSPELVLILISSINPENFQVLYDFMVDFVGKNRFNDENQKFVHILQSMWVEKTLRDKSKANFVDGENTVKNFLFDIVCDMISGPVLKLKKHLHLATRRCFSNVETVDIVKKRHVIDKILKFISCFSPDGDDSFGYKLLVDIFTPYSRAIEDNKKLELIWSNMTHELPTSRHDYYLYYVLVLASMPMKWLSNEIPVSHLGRESFSCISSDAEDVVSLTRISDMNLGDYSIFSIKRLNDDIISTCVTFNTIDGIFRVFGNGSILHAYRREYADKDNYYDCYISIAVPWSMFIDIRSFNVVYQTFKTAKASRSTNIYYIEETESLELRGTPGIGHLAEPVQTFRLDRIEVLR